MVKITFLDGSSKNFKEGVTGLKIAESISEGLTRSALAIKVDDKVWDLSREIKHDTKIQILTFKDKEGIEIFRHSTAHILADAVIQLFPYAKLTIGPVVDEGFYYDIDHEPFTPEDLSKIEAKMKEIANAKLKFERKEVTKKEALQIFLDNPYKTEMIRELKEDSITIYQQGKFIDLCRGPHVQHTGQIKAFKLTKIAGAYWRGNAKNKMLQRVYGISFADKKDLNQYLEIIEEAKKRDHRKLGKDLDLFSFHEEGPGFPFWHPNGMYLYNKLIEYARQENRKRGYEEIRTPTILNASLWKLSGHWDNFKEAMYFTKIDNEDYAVKPMNCPGGLLIYNTKIHSYKELPIRNAEFGYVHRHELSGVLSGLMRVRAFTQDDAHVFCTDEQLQTEIIDMLEYAIDIYGTFGFKEISTFIATRPEKSIGTNEEWEFAINSLTGALSKKKLDYKIKEGEGAFYGPKIEFNLKDALGRNWQCGTIQVDLSMPKRFKAIYDSDDGTRKTPIMIHRAILGSLERFIGMVIENYGGRFPLWINPRQVAVLSVSEKGENYAKKIYEKLFNAGFRVELDTRSESIPKKVRDAQLKQCNYILVVGEKDKETGTVTPRTRDGEIQNALKVDDFVTRLQKEINNKQ